MPRSDHGIAAGLMLLVAVWSMGAASAQTPQQIAQDAFAATVVLVMTDAKGKATRLRNGFQI